MTKNEVAAMIDHTLLKPEATKAQIQKLCDEAKRFHFASVCINPIHVKLASDELQNSEVSVCTVIGFPLGALPSDDKVSETLRAIENGADEVDMVIDIGSAKAHDFQAVENDIAAVVKAARKCGVQTGKAIIVKVILETCFLTDDEIVACCVASKNAGADFVKTSTGFATPKDASGKVLPNGATSHHVALMRKTVGSSLGVKASGGIRSAEATREMIEAGANRIGTSSGAAIVEGWKE